MSAYGTIAAPKGASQEPLKPRLYRLPDDSQNLAVVPLKREGIPHELAQHLADLFNGIVREGRTYPQEEELSLQSFQDYFLAYDLFLGLLVPTELQEQPEEHQEVSSDYFETYQKTLTSSTRTWKDVVAGCYYVKPNYPGRSSHCCNAGFIVDPKHRGLKLGRMLGLSYLHYGPALGYKYSVFNLVYVNNIASVKIWDSLGFTRAGLVPKAGRLKKALGPGHENDLEEEEYVDAILFWRDFATPVPVRQAS